MNFDNSKRVFLGLSTSCSRIPKKFPVGGSSKRWSKVAFCNGSCPNVARKSKTSLCLMLKYANCTTKVRFLSIFVQFSGVTSVAK